MCVHTLFNIGKAVHIHAMKAYRVRRGTALLILNLGTRGSVVSNVSWPLYPQEKNQYLYIGGWVEKVPYSIVSVILLFTN